jgi:hypothetical protein
MAAAQAVSAYERTGVISSWSYTMTDIVLPPDDPAERLKWAKGLLRHFSSPEGRDAVSAAELRAMAHEMIGELDPSVQSKPSRTRRANSARYGTSF